METFVLVIIIAIAIIQIIMVIAFFGMANNIGAIRNEIINIDNFKAEFYSNIAAGEKEKAKILLYKKVSKSSLFRSIAPSTDKEHLKSVEETLSSIYASELLALGISKFDFSGLLTSNN